MCSLLKYGLMLLCSQALSLPRILNPGGMVGTAQRQFRSKNESAGGDVQPEGMCSQRSWLARGRLGVGCGGGMEEAQPGMRGAQAMCCLEPLLGGHPASWPSRPSSETGRKHTGQRDPSARAAGSPVAPQGPGACPGGKGSGFQSGHCFLSRGSPDSAEVGGQEGRKTLDRVTEQVMEVPALLT